MRVAVDGDQAPLAGKKCVDRLRMPPAAEGGIQVAAVRIHAEGFDRCIAQDRLMACIRHLPCLEAEAGQGLGHARGDRLPFPRAKRLGIPQLEMRAHPHEH